MATSSIDYQARAERMIKRWAGVRGKVRTDEERKVNEIFTDRFENGKEPDEYVEGIIAQCGNCKIFVSVRFYVESILENLEVLKTSF